MGAVAEGLFRGMPTAAEVVNLLAVLDDLTVVVGDRDFANDFKGTVFHALDGDFHGILLFEVTERAKTGNPNPSRSTK
jgi:hypothetical protein